MRGVAVQGVAVRGVFEGVHNQLGPIGTGFLGFLEHHYLFSILCIF